MPLWEPSNKGQRIGDFIPADTTSSGTSVTANATPHSKGTYSTLIAATAVDATGIMVAIANTQTNNTATSVMVDIAVGSAGSEKIIIPDLVGGYANNYGNSALPPLYFFPLFIPAGSRISARSKSIVSSKVAAVSVTLFTSPRGSSGFVGTRVTAYGAGADTVSSKGVSITSGGANAYGNNTEIIASTTNPIRYLQLGIGGADGTFNASPACQAKLLVGTTILVDFLRFGMSASEIISTINTNFLLSHLNFNLPAASQLQAALMASTASTVLDFTLYGVD